MIKRLLFILRRQSKELKYRSFVPQKRRVYIPLPYFSQFETRGLIADILSKKISAQDDPHWRKSGATSKKEYELWSWNACGMACLKMIVAYTLHKQIPIVTLGKKCKIYGGYTSKKLEGLFYLPFLQFISKEFGLRGTIVSPMILSDIVSAIEKGNPVMASVSPHIDTDGAHPSHAGGHLVVVIGYDWNKKTITYHDPSGISKSLQENVNVPFSHFLNFFAYKGVIIDNTSPIG